jgi:hypothetical protein
LLVVLLQAHTQEAAAAVLVRLDLWELKQLKQEMAVRGKSLQSQVLACSTQGVAEVELILTEQHLAAEVVVVMEQKQAHLFLAEE